MSKIKNLLSKILRKKNKSIKEKSTDENKVKEADWGIQMAELYRNELSDNTEYWEVKADTDKKRYK